MNRIDETFRRLKADRKKALIPYIMAGDPSPEETRSTVLLLERCGADIVELGVPFTDPLADGPIIQRAAERALRAGVTLRAVIGIVRELRKDTHIPLLLMTYYNPVFKYGDERFVRDAVEAGVDGVIIPDLPPDEADSLIQLSRSAGLATVFLLAPTSTGERVKKVVKASRGFLYYVSMTGITGTRLLFDESIRESIRMIRKITDKPVAVGFGIATPDEARTVSEFADAVIVGSAIVKRLHESPENLQPYIIELRNAINNKQESAVDSHMSTKAINGKDR
ncbi:MAG TPA: tryptophan synthase subunit alpha [Nitrospiraceae bacterium]|jgi:tryptophan synthase alpha chain|nr:tryptophan synthase subunit alpha [Nitrospiraceae bacterium]